MKLIKPSFEILTPKETMQNMLQRIEAAGRTCYKSEDRITSSSAEKFIAMLLNRGHESVLEHEIISVRIICDRGISHELVRHRIASFSQESTRYCDYAGELEFIIPPWINATTDENGDINEIFVGAARMWETALEDCTYWYELLRKTGWKPEQARSVLPNSLKTEIVMTCNLREWRHFFKLRTTPAAHPQMREIAIPMLAEFQQQIPIIFDSL